MPPKYRSRGNTGKTVFGSKPTYSKSRVTMGTQTNRSRRQMKRKQKYVGQLKDSSRPVQHLFKIPAPQKQKGYSPFPVEWKVKMRYAHAFDLSANGLSTFGKITFRLNSLFDPDKSGAGHFPYQFNQLKTIYDRSIVYGAKVDLLWTNPTGDGLWVGFNIINASNSGGMSGKTLDVVQELPNASIITMNNSGSQERRQSVYIPLHSLNGCTKHELLAQRDKYSESTSGPAITAVNDIEFGVMQPNSGTNSISCLVTITYYAMLYDYRAQSQST